MLNFNTKKEILRSLRAKRNKNKLLWLPCVIAELCVKLWYAVVCSIDMALSDKNGNFLGVKMRKSEKTKKRKKDDIVHVKKPFFGRVLSAVLAFSFVFMMVPELGMLDLGVFAAYDTSVYKKLDELVTGRAVDSDIGYLFVGSEYAKVRTATVTNVNAIFADGCVKVTWNKPEGFDGITNSNIHYLVEYTGNNITNSVVCNNNTFIILEDLLDNCEYTITITPRIKISTYKAAYTLDTEGERVPTVDPDDNKQLYDSDGAQYVQSEIRYSVSGYANVRITPSVTLTSAEYNAASEEVHLTWSHSGRQVTTGDPVYGYAIYRAEVDSSGATGDYELIASHSFVSLNSSNDGVTAEFTDDEIEFGRIYKYYVIAYTDMFGGTEYAENQAGIVTSDTTNPPKESVPIPPSKIVNFEVVSNGVDGFDISWRAPNNSNVDGYFLYRSETKLDLSAIKDIKNEDGTLKYVDDETGDVLYHKYFQDIEYEGVVKRLPISGTSCEDVNKIPTNPLVNDKTYHYYLYPYVNASKGSLQLFGPVEYKFGIIASALARPQWDSVTTEDGKITLKWKEVPNADGYTIYIIKDKNYTGSHSGLGFQEAIDVGKVTTYTFDGLLNGDKYSYQIQAYSNVATSDSDKLVSELSAVKTITVGETLGIPQDVKVTTKDGQNTITWSGVDGAEGYYLYYRCNGGSWKYFDVTKENFTHTGLQNGDFYEYYVIAYKVIDKSYDPNQGGKEQIVKGEKSVTVSIVVGDILDAPKDFAVTTEDGVAHLSWTKVNGAEGYIIEASGSGHGVKEIDVSKEKYDHIDLENGDVWTYRVRAYKTVNGKRDYSDYTRAITVIIGISLNAPLDLTATAGNRQIDLSWTAVDGAEGYIVYLYDEDTMEYEPLTVTSKTSYSHVGLKNGKTYKYMVAAFKTSNGERHIGEYSMAVTAIPTTGSITDIDHTLNIKGTTPYGISHSEYISAKTNHDAFSESVDVYITTNQESTKAVKDVLKHYANGLKSFIIFPFDISVYKENTLIKVDPEDGYTVTMTIPIPDKLIAYRDYLTVVHINENLVENIEETEWYEIQDQRLEVLPCAILEIDNVWCVQFVCSNFSPYAFVIYKEHINDVSSGGGVMDGSFAGTFNSGMLLLTSLPDILPNNKKLTVVESKKRYRIKKVTRK